MLGIRKAGIPESKRGENTKLHLRQVYTCYINNINDN